MVFPQHPSLTRFVRRCASVVAVTAVLAAVPVAVRPAAASCARPYVAVKNDSWSRIAGKTGVSVSALLKANNANTRTMILIGQTVCLPKGTTWNQPSTRASGLRNLPAPQTRYSRAQAIAVIREEFPDHLEERAMAIVRRESKFVATAYTWCCVGLFQINWWAHKPWLKNFGVTKASQLLDARVNARAALEIYRRNSGWGPWE